MTQAKDTVITLQALDGQLEVSGVDRSPGIWPENVETSYNQWLCDQASFDLHRDPKVIWPDLRGGGLVEIEQGGKRVWKGRIKETPSRDVDRIMNVQCEGMQYHLDDDLIERKYVHSKLGDYRDLRTFLRADLTKVSTVGKVTTDRGVVTIGWAKGDAIVNGNAVGVMLDLGPGNTATRVVFEWERVGGQADTTLFVRGTNGEEPVSADYLGASNDVFGVALTTMAVSGTNAGTLPVASRYISALVYYSGAGGNFPADVIIKLKAIRVFADTAYESGNQSVLKASTIYTDALDRGTLLLSSDRSQIQVPTFSIPDFAPDRPRTPRELIEAGNAWQDWLTQIDVYDRPIFKPKPTAPRLEVGAWSPMEPEDSSQNSLEAIANGVIVAATATDGSQLRVERSAAHIGELLQGTTLSTGWSGPLSGGIGSATAGNPNTGPFRKGVPYIVRVTSISHVQVGGSNIDIELGDNFAGDAVPAGSYPPSYAGPGPFFLWKPTADRTNFGFKATFHGMPDDDSITIVTEVWWGHTLVDRRGFVRRKTLDVGFTLPTDGVAAAQLGDTWLQGHKLTPFKGQVKLTGPSAVRDMLTGLDVPLEHLGLYTGELLAFNDRTDPDTGGHGRDARMVAYKYNKDRDEGVVTLDNTKSDFETLLARLAVVTGQGA